MSTVEEGRSDANDEGTTGPVSLAPVRKVAARFLRGVQGRGLDGNEWACKCNSLQSQPTR